jgi:phenylalanyl-tRNA synthetase beta chain
MKFDPQWMQEYLGEAPDLDTLADRLTACGLLVELREPAGDGETWDIDVTTNRPDAMNHRGLAREAAVATGTSLTSLEVEVAEGEQATADLVTVEIAAPEICTRFCARVVRGVRMVPSPDWLRTRLERCGIRPINAVVDVTNYVLHGLGQPLHAYDLATIRDRRLVARVATDGETLTTLDGETRKLDPGMAVIADGQGVVGLAGVMGGASTEIGDTTVDVVLEAAHFNPVAVRRMARALGMHTEASHRFERGADPEMPSVAVDLAAAMIAELAGGTVCRGRIDVRPNPSGPQTVDLSIAALQSFAGLEIDAHEIIRILSGLGFSPQRDGDGVVCTVPSYRVDVERAADLYEEVLRHVGFDAVPAALPVLPSTPGRRHPGWRLADRGREAAVAAGLAEVMTYAFVAKEADDEVAEWPLRGGPALDLLNPLTLTQSTMRRSLLPGLVAAARDGVNQGLRDLAFFEQGRVFWSAADGRPGEGPRLGLVVAGTDSWGTGRDLDFAAFKAVVTAVVDRIGFPAVVWRRGGGPFLDDAEAAELVADQGSVIGCAGAVSSAVRDRFDLRMAVYVAELDLAEATEPSLPHYVELPRFPAVVADMTVEHDRSLEYQALDQAVRQLANDRVASIELLVRYAGKGLPPNVVRTTLRLVYRHIDRSLTQDEVNSAQDELRRKLTDTLGVTFA